MSTHASMCLPPPLTRPSTTISPLSGKTPSFVIERSNKSYKHQYSNIYYVRLTELRGCLETRAHKRWKNIAGSPELVPRVLEVEKGQLCYIVGTVYMHMPLKPNVMEDIARDHSIAPPPPPSRYYSAEDDVMLEDASGRIRLVGDPLKVFRLVTGVIVGALGMENPNGDFDVVDICDAGLAPQPSVMNQPCDEDVMDVDEPNNTTDSNPSDEWIATISGLDVGSLSPSDAHIQMLVEYLSGEAGGIDDQVSASQISRLIIAGDSLTSLALTAGGPLINIDDRKARRYGYDATNFSPHPVLSLSSSLHDIASVMPIHLLPGESDPSGTIMPQQPFPRAMFGDVSRFPTFFCETNPTYLNIVSYPDREVSASKPVRSSIKRSLLVNSGQPLNDMLKYLPSSPNTRLSLLESTLRWRHMAPTAPDTLWCHPYLTEDPFLIAETPDIYIVGGQKKFGTRMVSDPQEVNSMLKGRSSTRCRIVMVPSFSQTGVLVLINLRTLDVKCVKFSVMGMTSGAENSVKVEPSDTDPPSPTPVEPLSSIPKSTDSPKFM